jgi:hypothetical protein
VITLADRVGRPPSFTALAWTLLGLAGLTAGTILQSRLRPGAGPSAVAAVELAAGCAVLAVWAPLRGPVSIPITPHALGTFAWLALVTGVGGPLLLFTLIRQRGATRASSYLFLVPAVTAIGAWPILGTALQPTAVAGLAVAGAGLWLASPARAARRVSGSTSTASSARVNARLSSAPGRSGGLRQQPVSPWRDAVAPRTATGTLVGDDVAAVDDLAAPDSAELGPLHCPG